VGQAFFFPHKNYFEWQKWKKRSENWWTVAVHFIWLFQASTWSSSGFDWHLWEKVAVTCTVVGWALAHGDGLHSDCNLKELHYFLSKDEVSLLNISQGRLCHSSGSSSPASHRSSLGFIPGQAVWTEWCWASCSLSTLVSPANFHFTTGPHSLM
jgi:hypothetical protein